MKLVLSALWAGMAQLAVAAYLLASVTPGLTSNNFFDSYDAVPLWVAGAVAASVVTIVSICRSSWRPTAGALASTYILVRAVYVELAFGARAPWSSMLLAVALAVSIAWSWGRPPIQRGQVKFR